MTPSPDPDPDPDPDPEPSTVSVTVSWSGFGNNAVTTWLQTGDTWGTGIVKQTTTNSDSEVFEIPAGDYYLYCSGSAFRTSDNTVTVKVNGVSAGTSRVSSGTVYAMKTTNKITVSNGTTVALTFSTRD